MRALVNQPSLGVHRSLVVGASLVGIACFGPRDRDGDRPQVDPSIEYQESGTRALLQAVSAVDSAVVWVSGHQATFARTTDGGATWWTGTVSGPDSLQFRDVHAVNAQTAYLLSAGPGPLSRIYRTEDGGQSWTLQFTNTDPRAFYDCMDFWDSDHGMAFSDAVDGLLPVVATSDGVRCPPLPGTGMPAAREGEGGFAASGTCLVTVGDRRGWIGTGAGDVARVFRTADRGRSWAAVETPVVSGTPTSGIMALAFRDALHGVALGGELADPAGRTDNVAVTADGGATWTLAGRPQFTGAVYGAAYVPGAPTPTVVAVGPRGMDYSVDEGRTWVTLDTASYWSVAFTSPRAGWAVGPQGRIVKIGLFP